MEETIRQNRVATAANFAVKFAVISVGAIAIASLYNKGDMRSAISGHLVSMLYLMLIIGFGADLKKLPFTPPWRIYAGVCALVQAGLIGTILYPG